MELYGYIYDKHPNTFSLNPHISHTHTHTNRFQCDYQTRYLCIADY